MRPSSSRSRTFCSGSSQQRSPWSPSWSYGLVVRCDERMRPIASYHSRADGRVHGVTSLAEHGDTLMVGAQGSGVLVGLPRDPLLSGYPA